jgi:hypothetical protein
MLSPHTGFTPKQPCRPMAHPGAGVDKSLPGLQTQVAPPHVYLHMLAAVRTACRRVMQCCRFQQCSEASSAVGRSSAVRHSSVASSAATPLMASLMLCSTAFCCHHTSRSPPSNHVDPVAGVTTSLPGVQLQGVPPQCPWLLHVLAVQLGDEGLLVAAVQCGALPQLQCISATGRSSAAGCSSAVRRSAAAGGHTLQAWHAHMIDMHPMQGHTHRGVCVCPALNCSCSGPHVQTDSLRLPACSGLSLPTCLPRESSQLGETVLTLGLSCSVAPSPHKAQPSFQLSRLRAAVSSALDGDVGLLVFQLAGLPLLPHATRAKEEHIESGTIQSRHKCSRFACKAGGSFLCMHACGMWCAAEAHCGLWSDCNCSTAFG